MMPRDPGWGRGNEDGNIVVTINDFTGTMRDFADVGWWDLDADGQAFPVVGQPLTVGRIDVWLSMTCRLFDSVPGPGLDDDLDIEITKVNACTFSGVAPQYVDGQPGRPQDQDIELEGLVLPWFGDDTDGLAALKSNRFGMVGRFTVMTVSDVVVFRLEGDGLRVIGA